MIDKKGRLFGFINIIDLGVLIAILAIIVVGVKRMDGPQVSATINKKGIVTYEISDIRDITVDSIHVGDPVYHYDKNVYIGEIIKKDVSPYTEETEWEGQWIKSEVPDKYVVVIEVEADVEENDQYYTVGGEQTRVGIQYRMKNKSFASFGTCLGVEIVEE